MEKIGIAILGVILTLVVVTGLVNQMGQSTAPAAALEKAQLQADIAQARAEVEVIRAELEKTQAELGRITEEKANLVRQLTELNKKFRARRNEDRKE